MRLLYSLVVIICLFLVGCSSSIVVDSVNLDVENSSRVVYLYNWAEYTDPSILEDFEIETGIKVVLREYVETDQAISEIVSNPSDFDVMIVTIPVMEELKNTKLLDVLTPEKIPNMINVKDRFKSREYDVNNSYSIPYLWGTAGYVINTDYVNENVSSWNVYWDVKNKDRIMLMDHVRSGLVPIQKYIGVDVNTKLMSDLVAMEDAALLLKQNGVQFSDTITNLEKVISGDAWIGQVYNGDVLYLAADLSNIKYILPKEGFELSVDLLLVSSDSKHKLEAYELINYLSRVDISARNVEYFYYPSPIVGTDDLISLDILNNSLVYPNEDVFELGQVTIDVGDSIGEYNRIFELMK
ncbi:spermidine/putrescine ABC transporter substrate-binding protein [Candidatus Woesearchaeota archaeon]|nr:spermidine/putrescine ABC transporter substrate-binding protein [Candidatus Woesearchaeota archaeon]